MSARLGALVLVLLVAAPAVANHPDSGPVLTIDPTSLQRLRAEGRLVAVIDVRPAEAFARGRLPGARSIPLEMLLPWRDQIPAASIVVLYGAATVDEAAPAARYLRATGHRAVLVLEGGFANWQAHGLAVEPSVRRLLDLGPR